MANLPLALSESRAWLANLFTTSNFSGSEADFWHALISEMTSLPQAEWIRITLQTGAVFQTHREKEYAGLVGATVIENEVLEQAVESLKGRCRGEQPVSFHAIQPRPDSLGFFVQGLRSLALVAFQGPDALEGWVEIYAKGSLRKSTEKVYARLPAYLSQVTAALSEPAIADRELAEFYPRIIPERAEDQFLSETLLFLKREITTILASFMPNQFIHPFNVSFLLPYYSGEGDMPEFFQYCLDQEHTAMIAALEKQGDLPGLLQRAQEHRFRAGEGICGRIALTRSPTYLSPWKKAIASPEFGYDLGFLADFEGHFLQEDWLYSIPIVWKGKVICVVQTGGKRPNPKRSERKKICRVVVQAAASVRLAIEADQRRKEMLTVARIRNLSSFHSHNVSKAFIQPLVNQLAWLENHSEHIPPGERRDAFREDIAPARFLAQRLLSTFRFLDQTQVAGTAKLRLEEILLRDLFEDEIVPLVRFRRKRKSRTEQTDLYVKHVALRLDGVPKRLMVRAHSIQLVQVFFTIIDNAIDALSRSILSGDPRRGSIWIRAAKKGKHTEVAIIDRGEGISKHHLDVLATHLTEVAERKAAALAPEEKKLTTRGGDHLGLGLHCAAVYLSLFSNEEGPGRVLVAPRRGGGTKVTVCIPTVEGENLRV